MSGKAQKSLLFFYNDYESLGLEYISAVLKASNIKTDLIYKNLIDYYAFDSSKNLKEEFYKKIAREIIERNPDVLALSLLTDTFQINMGIAREVKKLNPEIKVFAGGVHASLLPELTLSYPQVDALCIGEGEYSSLAYMENMDLINSGKTPCIKGVVYKQKGRLVGNLTDYIINEDLDSLPIADKDLFYNADPSMKSHYFVQCSRGCPFVCSYCINDFRSSKVDGKRFRHRTPERIIDELVSAKEKYSFSFVVFVDECFGIDPKWTSHFLSLYTEKLRIPFLVSVHPNLITPQLADLMKEANCWYIAMGVQSLNEEISKNVLKRFIRRERIAKSIEIIRSRKITLQCDHIFGIPGENEKDMVEALTFYNEHRPSLVSVYWLTYYPKAFITNYAKNIGFLSQRDIEDIEHGRSASGIKKVIKYHGINFWFNYFIFFPKWFIRFIINSGFYYLFKIKNFYITSAFPRALHAILHKKDWNRYYMKRIIIKKLNNLRFWSPS